MRRSNVQKFTRSTAVALNSPDHGQIPTEVRNVPQEFDGLRVSAPDPHAQDRHRETPDIAIHRCRVNNPLPSCGAEFLAVSLPP